MRESAASAKRFCFMFGAKPAQSEMSARAAGKRRPPGRGAVGGKRRSYLEFMVLGVRVIVVAVAENKFLKVLAPALEWRSGYAC